MAQLIRITSRQAGFRRCGVAHPAEPAVYAPDHFSPDELARLQAEPMLVVEIVPEEETQDGLQDTQQGASAKAPEGEMNTHEAEGQPEGTGEAQAGADASAPVAGAESAAPATDKPAQKRAKAKD